MSRYVTAAYVFDRGNMSLRDEDAQHIDQLNYSFALVRDGSVSGDHWSSIEAYRAYIARHPHILPVVSIGGWAAGGFSEAAATEEGRARFADTAVALMQRYGFLGVDIDWEYPCSDEAGIAASPEDRHNFTLLLQALRQRLDALTKADGKKRLLAAAVGAAPELVHNIECEAVGQLIDQLNLMTYDIQTRYVMSHATALYTADPRYPKCADTAVRVYSEAGVPKEKMMVGCACYARLFEAKEGTPKPFGEAATAGFDTKPYRELVSESGWTHGFDEAAGAAYAVRGNWFASYDSVLSVSGKGAYVKERGLQGLMYWEYGSDLEGQIIGAMHKSLEE